MIICPSCEHQNPDGATQCESCYTPLPTGTFSCPNCGAPVPSNAAFCGQCNYPLQSNKNMPDPNPEENKSENGGSVSISETKLSTPDPVIPDPVIPDPVVSTPSPTPVVGVSPGIGQKTALQPIPQGSLFHLQTQTKIDLPSHLQVIHVGKPNDQIPPDVDVSGFPDSEIVSRIHADIRLDADVYYIEDVGSANGTYINHIPLPAGNRHRLRTGDRISLGKGDKVTFIFQIS